MDLPEASQSTPVHSPPPNDIYPGGASTICMPVPSNDRECGNSPASQKTFRIQGVPFDWDVERLRSFIKDHNPSLQPSIASLAREIHGNLKTGTVGFQPEPCIQSWRIVLPKPPEAQLARRQYLELDNGFLGMTTLYTPPAEDHSVDVVAISGLGGHAFGSFKERKGDHMWLRDSLPYDLTAEATDLPMARVMIYGYESTVAESKSFQNLEDLATSFHSSLLPLIRGKSARPIVFIAHSLGGLIVKQTLISLARSESPEDQKLLEAVYGIAFFGVPHVGMDIGSLISMVEDGPNRFLVESIGAVNSHILSSQRRDFVPVLGGKGDSEVFCFFETLKSPTAEQDETGKWAMTGPDTVLVSKSSATLCRPWEDGPEHICAISRTHSDLVKFGPHDHEYHKVCDRLTGLIRRASAPRISRSQERLTGGVPELSHSLNEALNSLPTAKDAPFNAYGRQDERTCLPDTRVDLLHEIYSWADDEHSPGLFWLSGLAGTGKSTVAKTVAAHYHAKRQLAGSFFFSRGGGDVSHAGMFVTSIAVQLARIPDMKPKVCEAIAKHNDIAYQSLDDQWQELIAGPLLSLSKEGCQSTYVLVVDALDECEGQENVQRILRCLVQPLQNSKLRVLLTSRPEVPIQNGFMQVPRDEHRDFNLHQIDPLTVDHDIAVFLRSQLEIVRQECGFKVDWPKDSDVERLVRNSGGLFIWADTACRFVGGVSQLAEARLSSLLLQGSDKVLPPERKLDEIYNTVLANSVQGERSEEEDMALHRLFRELVGPIVTLQDPLPIAGLAELLGKDVASLKRALANLRSVLDVPDIESSSVRLLHPSFRDFLLSKDRCSDPRFHINERLVHRQIYERSLQVLEKHLRRDMCNLEERGARTTSRTEVDRHIQLHVQYACRFWVYHCGRSDIDSSTRQSVKAFFQHVFLYWLEALAWLGRISDAVDMVHVLDSMFSTKGREQTQVRSRRRGMLSSTLLSRLSLKTNSTSAPTLSKANPTVQLLVHDAVRFVLAFRPILEEAPLQVYYAGLVFSPQESIIKEIFSKQAPDWLLYMPEVLERWPACVQTLKGHSGWVVAVAFSPDGKMLASASHDETVKLWDAGSGACVQTLKGHSGWVVAVAFSPDGKTLASASHDKTVKLWDAGSGACVQTLKGHSGWVEAVAFSPDGKTLASASDDETVKLWDARSGACVQTLTVDSVITSLSFSDTEAGLHTDRGYLRTTTPSDFRALSPPASSPPSIFIEEAWISLNGKRVLWLPSEYRPQATAVRGSSVGFGCQSGQVLLLRFAL